ncbi:MAG: Nramp family divalent metal transporter [Acidobacteria bacterium]|nr:Nramp family divalent metal transporter [Acidobacteriota bacterium]
MPAPPPFTGRNVLRTIGPGIIGLGAAIGSGEWLLGPSVIVAYGPSLLWITTVAVLLQVLLNLEMARYTVYTGEPIISGFMRTWPGPGFWGCTYGALSFLQYGWPGWALASATATAALLLGRMPTEADAGLVVRLGYLTFGACFLITMLGKKVERTLEVAMWLMVGFVGAYLLLIDLTTVSWGTWSSVLAGFATVGRLPEDVDWALIGAFAAYSGMGGIGNAFFTNWMRDKGYGMGATVGYIPTALGDRVTLSPQGNVFEVNDDSLESWRNWWKFLNVDQWGVFGLGSLVGMGLMILLTLEYVTAGSSIDGWAVANLQASGIAAVHGPIFWYLTLIAGVWVLFSTQLALVDGLPRAITDMLWTSSAAVRRWRGGDVRAVYYSILAVFAVWGCVALNLAQPLTLIIIGANVAGFTFLLESLHTLVVNRKFLPPALRPPWWREASVLLCALFYGGFVVLALVQILG